jgi:hypothetical protein
LDSMGEAKRAVMALGLLTLQLREFRVDGAQTPLTGHLPPPPHSTVGRGLAVYRDSAVSAKNVTCNGLQSKWVRTAINGKLRPDYLHLSIP